MGGQVLREMNLDEERSATLPNPVQRQLLFEWTGIQALHAAHDDAATVISLEQALQRPQAMAHLQAHGDNLIGRFRRRAQMAYRVLQIDRRIE